MKITQLSHTLRENSPEIIISEVNKIFEYHYDGKNFDFIDNIFYEIVDLFSGKFPGYQQCNTEYHNLEHTFEVFLTAARMIDGYNLIEGKKIYVWSLH